jgi:hypothetical protein
MALTDCSWVEVGKQMMVAADEKTDHIDRRILAQSYQWWMLQRGQGRRRESVVQALAG